MFFWTGGGCFVFFYHVQRHSSAAKATSENVSSDEQTIKTRTKTGAVIESHSNLDLVIKGIRFATACGVCSQTLQVMRAPSIHVKQIGSTGTIANCQ